MSGADREGEAELRGFGADARATFKRNERLELIAALDRLVLAYALLVKQHGDAGAPAAAHPAYARAVAVLRQARSFIG